MLNTSVNQNLDLISAAYLSQNYINLNGNYRDILPHIQAEPNGWNPFWWCSRGITVSPTFTDCTDENGKHYQCCYNIWIITDDAGNIYTWYIDCPVLLPG